jgi:hypothetical protein
MPDIRNERSIYTGELERSLGSPPRAWLSLLSTAQRAHWAIQASVYLIGWNEVGCT